MSDIDDAKVNEPQPRVISRRELIKGVIVGGAAGERLITVNVNGQQRRVDAMKQETLSWTLRHKLGLTGTKIGCDRAECGSCTVLIDGVPHYACSVLTHTLRDR